MCAISDVILTRYAVLIMGNICAEKAPPEDPTPDPETGLNQKERRLLKELWLVLTDHATLKEEGVKFSNKLFIKFPTMIEYYPEFVGKNLRETGKSIALRAHGIAVIFGMTSYIECIDDPGAIVSLIQRMAMSHNRYGVTAVEMEKLLDVLYEFVRDECGDVVNRETFVALKKLLKFHHKVYEQTFDSVVPDAASLQSCVHKTSC